MGGFLSIGVAAGVAISRYTVGGFFLTSCMFLECYFILLFNIALLYTLHSIPQDM